MASYLRVYEPLTAFDPERAEFWRRYVAAGRAPTTDDGPARQRRLLYDNVGPQWETLPEIGDEAYVVGDDDAPLVCPWRLPERNARAIRQVDQLIPSHLRDAFVSPALMAEALDVEIDLDPRNPKQPVWHENLATWHVPIRWFVCMAEPDRELRLDPDRRILRFRVPMARARRRARHAYGILQTSLGAGNPVTAGIRQLCDWLSAFHPRSLVELDYGGLVRVLSDTELRDDNSPRLVHDGLAALAQGDMTLAGEEYERLMRRWRRVRLRERRN